MLVGGFDSMTRAPHAVRMRPPVKAGDQPLIDVMVHDGLYCSIADAGMGAHVGRREPAARGQPRGAGPLRRRLPPARRGRRAPGWPRRSSPLAGLEHDEGIRPQTTYEALAKLRPAFGRDGTITAGNASQVSDGAAAALITTRRPRAVDPLAEIVGRAVVAGPDSTLHLRPAEASHKLLERHGLKPADIALWEINEAFAGVTVAAAEALEIDLERVNVNGGAVALGHPLAGSGLRLDPHARLRAAPPRRRARHRDALRRRRPGRSGPAPRGLAVDVLVIGAGPYGLATAAAARARRSGDGRRRPPDELLARAHAARDVPALRPGLASRRPLRAHAGALPRRRRPRSAPAPALPRLRGLVPGAEGPRGPRRARDARSSPGSSPRWRAASSCTPPRSSPRRASRTSRTAPRGRSTSGRAHLRPDRPERARRPARGDHRRPPERVRVGRAGRRARRRARRRRPPPRHAPLRAFGLVVRGPAGRADPHREGLVARAAAQSEREAIGRRFWEVGRLALEDWLAPRLRPRPHARRHRGRRGGAGPARALRRRDADPGPRRLRHRLRGRAGARPLPARGVRRATASRCSTTRWGRASTASTCRASPRPRTSGRSSASSRAPRPRPSSSSATSWRADAL